MIIGDENSCETRKSDRVAGGDSRGGLRMKRHGLGGQRMTRGQLLLEGGGGVGPGSVCPQPGPVCLSLAPCLRYRHSVSLLHVV